MKKKIVIFISLFFCLFLFSGCEKDNHLEEINLKDYKTMIENNESFVLEIMKTDCPSCKAFKPKLVSFLDEYNITIKYINVENISESDYEELMSITNITGTPTILFYKDGEESSVATRIVGNVSKERLISKFIDNKIIEEK